jgi:hypothetical protein
MRRTRFAEVKEEPAAGRWGSEAARAKPEGFARLLSAVPRYKRHGMEQSECGAALLAPLVARWT